MTHKKGLTFAIVAAHQPASFRQTLKSKPSILPYFITACLIVLNWFVYVWAVNQNYIIEASLGYFINQLISILMGVVFLRERLRTFQWLPLTLAGIGVIHLTLVYGHLISSQQEEAVQLMDNLMSSR